MSTPRFVSVARALAMVGSVAAAATSSGGCTQLGPSEAHAQTPPRPTPPPPPPACPPSVPSDGSSCVGHAPQQLCDFGFARCTCTPGTGSFPPWRWSCQYRAVPGPLPPPELV